MISYLIIAVLTAILIYIIVSKKKTPPVTYARDITVVRGYMTADEDDYVFIYSDKPVRCGNQWCGDFLLGCSKKNIDKDKLYLDFESDPVEVEVTIRTKA